MGAAEQGERQWEACCRRAAFHNRTNGCNSRRRGAEAQRNDTICVRITVEFDGRIAAVASARTRHTSLITLLNSNLLLKKFFVSSCLHVFVVSWFRVESSVSSTPVEHPTHNVNGLDPSAGFHVAQH